MPRTYRNIFVSALALASVAAQAANDPSPTFWNRPNLFGDVGGLRPALQTHGIDFSPVYTGEIFGEVSGSQGGNRFIYDHNLNLPLTVDLEKAAGWRGALLHANVFWLTGRSLSQDSVHDLANVSNIAAYPTVRLQELWLQQNFWNQRASVKIGALAVDNDFFTATSSALFINSSFGTFALIAANLPSPPIYPVAAPAVRFSVQPDPHFYFQAGIFDGDSGAQDQNKNGVQFHFSDGDGALIFSEIGFNFHPDADEKTLAGSVKLGSFVHTKHVPTWASRLAGDEGGTMNYGFYAVAEHELFKCGAKKITAFARGGLAPAERNVIGHFFDVGFNFTGFLPGRANDVAGIAFARPSFTSGFSKYQQSVNGSAAFDSENVLELTYRAQLTPWWTLQPDFQLILTPGGESKSENAVVLGLRTSLLF